MENKKNIWIISQYNGSPYHGMNYRSYYLAKEFVYSGDDVTIFTGSYSHLFTHYPKTKGLFTNESIDGINYIWVKTPKYKKSKSIGRLFSMVMFMINLFFFNIYKKKKPDVIIISSLSLFPVLNAFIWAKLLRIDFILEIRDLWPLTLIEVGKKSKYHPLVLVFGWFEKFGYRNAKYVVSLLPNAKKHMISRGMSKHKYINIPNGVNLQEVENYKNISETITKKLPESKFIVGYIGTIGLANALDYFLEAAEKLRKNTLIHFVLVGKGGEKHKLQEYCRINKLPNVTFISPIPKIQVQSMLQLFDACYIGAHKHNIYKYGVSANKIFDYMYSAKPIIYSIESGDNLITSAKCGISITSEDSEEIKEAILKLALMNKDELLEMGRCGKEYVIKYHDYNILSRSYKKIM